MTSFQRLCVLFGWHESEERARKACLHRRLSRKDGEQLLKIMLLALLNGAKAHPFIMRELTAEIIDTFSIDAKTVNGRIKDLIAIGYVTKVKHTTDDKVSILVVTEQARANLERYADELIGITDAMHQRLAAYGPMPVGDKPCMHYVDILEVLARLTEMEAKIARNAA